MKAFIIFMFIIVTNVSSAQNDTVYVTFRKHEFNSSIKWPRHSEDTESRVHFPFDGGRIYIFLKNPSRTKIDEFRFSYLSYTPNWMSRQFSYIELPRSELRKLIKSEDFIDIKWFQEREAREIIEYFGRNDPNEKVIMLYDDTQPKSKCQYLVRVYFDFTAFE